MTVQTYALGITNGATTRVFPADSATSTGKDARVYVVTDTARAYLGGPELVAGSSDGIGVSTSQPFGITVRSGDELWATCTAASATVRVMIVDGDR